MYRHRQPPCRLRPPKVGKCIFPPPCSAAQEMPGGAGSPDERVVSRCRT
jgi:hypothetical protein